MSGLSPTGGAPTAGGPTPAGSGALLVGGSSSAIFFNGATYMTGVFNAAGGSAASFVGTGAVATIFNVAIFENLIATDMVTPPSAGLVLNDIIVDTASITQAQIVALGLHMTQGMTWGGTASYIWVPGANIVEGFKLHATATGLSYMKAALTEKLKVAERLVVGLLASISENMTLTPVLEAYVGTVILARILMHDTAVVAMKYAVTATEALRIAETFKRFIGGTLVDGFTIGDAASESYKAIIAITEALTLAINQTYYMAFRLTVADGVDLDDNAVLNMIFRQTMTETFDLEILYQSPEGNVATFAMNTRTGAVTEYDGWAFNSFVQIGNKYVGANKDGLFELNGPTDNGLNVVADIVGGYLQPAGQHLAGLKGVYLGQSGQGYWLLKLQTGDNREYIYQRLSNPGLMTTKFNIGKGINARYIGWELINVEGQDFDLDSIEFVPMLRTRRI